MMDCLKTTRNNTVVSESDGQTLLNNSKLYEHCIKTGKAKNGYVQI